MRRWTETGTWAEAERYLRMASLVADSVSPQWTVRAFGPAEWDARPTAAQRGPWQNRFRRPPRRGVWVLRPSLDLAYNYGFPWGMNDGPTWAGRGPSVAVSFGVAGRLGPLSVQVAPSGWWSANEAFEMIPSARPAGDYAAPSYIDWPQRLAADAVGRLDAGESVVRLDLLGMAAGLSSAVEWWGPSQAAAAVLGHEAAGVPRVFLGTSRPLDFWIGQIHGRAFAGREVASTNGVDVEPKRLGLGAVGTFTPRGAPWLNLGAIRFFHRRWREGGPTLADISALWEGFLKVGLPTKDDMAYMDPDNQLASIFARVAIPGSGAEVYTEFMREDHSFDTMDLINEPDHISAVLFGFQKVLRRTDDRWWAVRGEVQNGRVTHLGRTGRGQGLFYEHFVVRDGHTFRGQLLGSRYIRGGSGGELGVDRVTPDGRLSIRWQRVGLATQAEGGLGFGAIHGIEVSGVRFRAARDLGWRLGVAQRIGRDLELDLTNLHLALQWRGLW